MRFPSFLLSLFMSAKTGKIDVVIIDPSFNRFAAVKNFLLEHNLIIANVVLLSLMFAVFREPMLTREARLSFFHMSTMLGFLTLGQAMVILIGGIDVSNGAIVGLTSILAAWIALGYGIPLILVVTLLVAIIIGSISGLLVTKANFPPLIATLVTLGVATGLSLSVTGGAPIQLKNAAMTWFGSANLEGLPYYSLIWIALVAIVYLIVTRTKFGRHIYALGGSEKAAYVCGVNNNKIKLLVYLMSALLAWTGGVIYSCYTASGVPIAGGLKYMMDSVSAAVIGGVLLSGGKGNLLDATLGVVFFALLYMAVIFLNISPVLEGAFRGVLLLVVVLYAFAKEKKKS
jgi:ribose/xylose/arabinose/galactoside ABC-type transport system permease subunit